MAQLTVVRFVIENGSTASNEQDVRDFQLLALQMSPAWTAANITLKARAGLDRIDPVFADDDLVEVVDGDGLAISLTVAAAKYVVLTGDALDAMAAVAYLQLVSSATQLGQRTILGVAAVG
jgi:hypothetical protein